MAEDQSLLNEEFKRAVAEHRTHTGAMTNLEAAHDVKLTEEAPIVRIAHTIIQQAIRDRASEFQVEPCKKEIQVHFLIDGVQHRVMTLPKEIQADLVARYKRMAEMDVTEQNAPQDGHIGIMHQGKDYDLTTHSEPTPDGERIKLRILAR